MFFRKKRQSKTRILSDLVKKTSDTGNIFIDINNDLGVAVESGADEWPPELLMVYGYSRRAAVAALYVQGFVENDLYEHVKAMFKGIQSMTGQTVDFQKQAASESVIFMSEYNPVITSFMVKKIVQIAEEYEIPSGTLSDAELFEYVIETAHFEQNILPKNDTSPQIDIDIQQQQEYIHRLYELSEKPGKKDHRMQIFSPDFEWHSSKHITLTCDLLKQDEEPAVELANKLYELRPDLIIQLTNIVGKDKL